jgi:hypothetical protein
MNQQPDKQNLQEAISLLEGGSQQPFAICEQLAEKVARLMIAGDPRAEDCLSFVARTYDRTPFRVVRLAIENCFLYHLGNRIFSNGNHRSLLELLPRNLHETLVRQMTASGL